MFSIPRPRGAAGLLGFGLALSLFAPPASAQDAPLRGIRRVDPRWHALVHATLVPAPGERIEDATIVVRDGVIESVTAGGAAPEGARVWDCTGHVVHAGWLDAHVEVDAPREASETDLDHWHHELITPQRSALDGSGLDADARKALREIGFTSAAIAPGGGILAGRAAVVALGDDASELEDAAAEVVRADVYAKASFQRRGFRSSGDISYPTSEMGAIALMRQAFIDADHYSAAHAAAAKGAEGEPPAPNDAMEALQRSSAPPLLFDAQSELQALRAARVAGEFVRPLMLLGSGTEYRRLDAIVDLGLPILVPLDFPDAPDVSTQAKAEGVDLRALLSWESAPHNPRWLVEAGVTAALTTSRMGDRGDFPKQLRAAIEAGLDPERALAMLTTIPAELLGVDDRLGRVAPGMLAHLVVLDGEPFEAQTKVASVWVGGRRYEVTAPDAPSHDGVWSATFERLGDREKVEGTVVVDGGKKVTVRLGEEELEGRKVDVGRHHAHFHLDGDKLGVGGTISVSALFEGDVAHGSATGPDGVMAFWRGERTSTEVPEDDGEEEAGDPDESPKGEGDGSAKESDGVPEETAPLARPSLLPFGAYGYGEVPAQRTVRVENATLWTGGEAGIVEGGTLVVEGGRVVYAGAASGAPATPGAEVIDAAGKHVTPGIIDCHSHTGISGSVNEVGERVTSEVRIADVIDPDDMSYYRQLAGGLTAANQLHGSANAIGGQNSVVKLRWGAKHPDDMRLAGAPGGIKFALGENPKRVAAGTDRSDEYPQTRLGVEALIRDRLTTGRDYGAEWARYRALSPWERERTLPPRRDLELEAMAEIVAGERLIHCHSYRQDEILMLARIAQEFGFKIGTFQHVLEGYKVADAVADSALGGSTFSDWWAYKFEVVDAIPHNATLMTLAGANVSINSDSDEHARRLNTEAAKAVKYGGLDRHAALQLVTLNPAIQLGIDDRVGSLEAGKDADFVIWSGDPLSYASRCESTWIDGREYFSLGRDAELRAKAHAERQRLVQKLLEVPASERSRGSRGGAGRGRRPGGAMTLREAYALGLTEELEALWRGGDDVNAARRGECGCWDVYLMFDRAENR